MNSHVYIIEREDEQFDGEDNVYPYMVYVGTPEGASRKLKELRDKYPDSDFYFNSPTIQEIYVEK